MTLSRNTATGEFEERTTNLAELRKGALFVWGEIVRIEDIGDFTVATVRDWKVDGCTVLVGQASDRITFFGWIGGRSASRSWNTMEGALAGLMAIKHDGVNSQAGDMFVRMLRIKGE